MSPRLRSNLILIIAALFLALSFALFGGRIDDLTASYTTGVLFQLPTEENVKVSTSFLGIGQPGRVIMVTTDSPGYRAGIHSGDEIMAIDGIPIDQKERLEELNARVRQGETLTFTLRREGRELSIPLRLESPLEPLSAKIGIGTDLAVAFTFMTIGGLVFWRRRFDLRAELFFLFSAAAAATYLIMTYVTLPDYSALGGDSLGRMDPLFIVATAMLGLIGYFLPASFLHLTMVFPKPLPVMGKFPRVARWIYLLPVVLIASLMVVGFLVGISENTSPGTIPWLVLVLDVAITALVVVAVVRLTGAVRRQGWLVALLEKPGRSLSQAMAFLALFVCAGLTVYSLVRDGDQGSLLIIGIIFLPIIGLIISITLAYPVLSCVALIFGYRQAGHEEKRQLRWPLWGTLVALSGTVILGLLYWVMTLIQSPLLSEFYFLSFNLGKAFYLLIPISFAVGIFKYRLMDIDIIIRKTVIYALVTGILVAVFLILSGGVGGLLVEVAGVTNIWGIIFAILAVVALLYPLYNWARDFVDRRFFRTRYDYPEALSAIGQYVKESTDSRHLVRFVAETVQQSLRSRALAVFLRSERDADTCRMAETVGIPESQQGQSIVIDAEAMGHRIDHHRVIRRSDLLPSAFRLWQRTGLEQAVAVMMAGKLTGLLAVGRKYPDGELEKEDIDFLFQAADLLASGLARLRVHQQSQDLEVAREIQRRMLPQQIPQVAGLSIAKAWQPSRMVGGDYFDLVDLGQGKLGILIADVAGKGMSAALLMSNMQAAFRAMANPELSPREVVNRLNQVMTLQMAVGRFITLFYGVYQLDSRELQYVNAGHCPPFLMRSDGSTDLLEQGGLITGVFPEAEYEQGLAHLNESDCLVLFTDGITEAEDSDFEPFGEDRLLALIRRHAAAGPARLVEEILAAVREHSGGEPQDDLTLMVISVESDAQTVATGETASDAEQMP
jgi:serine phosphatase RsbU (regulator of sigma subunit)